MMATDTYPAPSPGATVGMKNMLSQPVKAIAQQFAAAPDGSLATALPNVEVTSARPPAVEADRFIPHAGVPRVNKAVSAERPQGAPESRPDLTVLQQHTAFFDRNNDGIIAPWDTFIGFRRLGFGNIISGLAGAFIHFSFAYPSSPSWIPDPLFRIHMKNMHRTKHGSDSEVYDTEGRFVPQKFEDLFSKFDKGNKGALSFSDIADMVRANRNIMDPVGWIASRLEWWTLWWLAKDANGLVSKEKVRGQFDGTLWNQIASEVEARKLAEKQKWQ